MTCVARRDQGRQALAASRRPVSDDDRVLPRKPDAGDTSGTPARGAAHAHDDSPTRPDCTHLEYLQGPCTTPEVPYITIVRLHEHPYEHHAHRRGH